MKCTSYSIKILRKLKYFCITEYLYPVFYFTTRLNKSYNYYNDTEDSGIFVYNNGSLLKINYRNSGNQRNTYVVEEGIRMKYLIDNGKGIVTNKIIKFLFRTLGIKWETCSYCKSILLDDSKSILYTDVINNETIKERGYNHELCENRPYRECCYSFFSIHKDKVPVIYINNNLYNYNISEDITNNRKSIHGSPILVIENMILEMLNDQNAIPEYLRLSEIISDTEKLYTRLQETDLQV